MDLCEDKKDITQNKSEIHWKNMLSLCLILTVLIGNIHQAACSYEPGVHVYGYVTDIDGDPIQDAEIILYGYDSYDANRRLIIYSHNKTGEDGWYQIEAGTNALLNMIVIKDNVSTPGYDWYPRLYEIESGYKGQFDIILYPAANVVLSGTYGSITEEISTGTEFRAIQAEYQSKASYNSQQPEIDREHNYINNDILQLNSTTIIIPAGEEYYISYGHRNILNTTDSPLNLTQGEEYPLNVTDFCFQTGWGIVEETRNISEGKIQQADSYAFYTLQEKIDYRKATDEISLAGNNSNFEEAFTQLRNAYLLFTGIIIRIDQYIEEATFSMRIIVFFIGVTSLILAGIMVEDRRRVPLSIFIFIVLFGFFARIYPGSNIIPISEILLYGASALLGASILIAILRYVLSKGKKGGIGLYDYIASTQQIALRNLKRRKGRAALTFMTLFTITVGFVSLTSISSNYGLVHTVEQSSSTLGEGIMVRMQEYISPYKMEDEMYGYDVGFFYSVDQKSVDWIKSHQGVTDVILRAEVPPTIQGIPQIIGLDVTRDPIVEVVNSMVVKGVPLTERGTCLVHEARLGKEENGDTITIIHEKCKFEKTQIGTYDIGDYINGLRIVGGFSDDIENIRDIDGTSILPNTKVPQYENSKTLIPVPINPKRLVITELTDAKQLGIPISKAQIITDENCDKTQLLQSLALGSEYRYWWTHNGESEYYTMGNMVETKGMTLTVPWGIAVLTVIATMLGSMYERKSEVNILSSVGLNPGHISAIFLNESLILGVTAGSLGYILGMGMYPLFTALSFAPAVQQKISAVWSIAALGISVASVIIGTLIALTSSITLTPSMKMKWKISKEDKDSDELEVWNTKLPLSIEPEKKEEFAQYLETSIQNDIIKEYDKYAGVFVKRITHMRRLDSEAGDLRWLLFYRGGSRFDQVRVEATFTKNKELNAYELHLKVRGNEEGVNQIVGVFRNYIMKWSTIQGRKDI